MALNINKMDYNTLYKTLDEREMYYTTGITYVAKYKNLKKITLSKKPIIFTYNFDLDGKINYIVYGELINHKYQCGVEYSIMGWIIDKNSKIDEIGDKKNAREITCAHAGLTPISQNENELLNIEISKFLKNPVEYFEKDKIMTRKCIGNG